MDGSRCPRRHLGLHIQNGRRSNGHHDECNHHGRNSGHHRCAGAGERVHKLVGLAGRWSKDSISQYDTQPSNATLTGFTTTTRRSGLVIYEIFEVFNVGTVGTTAGFAGQLDGNNNVYMWAVNSTGAAQTPTASQSPAGTYDRAVVSFGSDILGVPAPVAWERCERNTMLDVLIAAVIHLSGDYGIGNTVVLNTASCPLNTVDTGQTINGAEVCEQVNAGSVVIGASYGTTIVQSGWGGYEPYLLNVAAMGCAAAASVLASVAVSAAATASAAGSAAAPPASSGHHHDHHPLTRGAL